MLVYQTPSESAAAAHSSGVSVGLGNNSCVSTNPDGTPKGPQAIIIMIKGSPKSEAYNSTEQSEGARPKGAERQGDSFARKRSPSPAGDYNDKGVPE